MRFIRFNDCSGWLHVHPAGYAAKTAVILCPGVKTDGLNGYRSFRLLSNALANVGFSTLRFDYPGTGNSSSLSVSEHWEDWQQSIHAAADWLRDYSGADQIVLCGLRFGATLAAVVAANRTDVAGLMLLAPIFRGRSYIRQLTIEAHEQVNAASLVRGLLVGELELSARTVQEINRIDLRRVALPQGCRTFVCGQTQSLMLSECLDFWRAGGVDVTNDEKFDLEPMLRPTFMSHRAPADVSYLVRWLQQSISVVPYEVGSHSLPHPDAALDAEMWTTSYVETPLRFGDNDRLFGIVCRPLAGGTDMAMVICSSSGDPHSGPVGVDLARCLAAEGIASLRFDFAGLGDSIAPGDAPTHVFETNRAPDISAAVDALLRLAYRRFAIYGLCSGAYHAFHGSLADRRIGFVAMVNLPVFKWRTGDPIEYLGLDAQTPAHLLQMLTNWAAWKQLLMGRGNLQRRLAWPKRWIAGIPDRLRRRLAQIRGAEAPANFAVRSMETLSERARTLFCLAQGDFSVEVVMEAFGSGDPPPGSTIRILSTIDHSLTTRAMRRIIVEQIVNFLSEEDHLNSTVLKPCGNAAAGDLVSMPAANSGPVGL